MVDAPLNIGDVPTSDTKAADDALLAKAHAQWKLILTAEGDLRTRMLDDYRFVDEDYGQWPASIKAERDADGRPCLQIDRTSGQIRQVSNRILQGRPAIEVTPVDNGADMQKAEVRQGVIRYIEDESDAEGAYATGLEHQLKFGRGYWRVVAEYIHDDGDDPALLLKQEPRIVEIENPFGVYCDPAFRYASQSTRGKAMRFAFIPEDLDPEDYRDRFGEEPPGGLDSMRGTGDAAPDWFPRGKIRIAEYYYAESTWEDIDVEGVKRRVERRKVKWCLITAVSVLERRDIPGPYIPVVPIVGERTNIDGVIDYKGLVRRAKDPQRMVNYGRSKAVETEALAPVSPFIAAFGQIEQYKKVWDSANTRNWSVLPYDPQHVGGSLVPEPKRNFGEPPIQALMGMNREFENDLRAVMHMPDVQGQELRREQSGKAIQFRDMLSESGNSHFAANLRRAIVLTGRILNAWVPVYFDVPTQLEIVGKDGKPRQVVVHAGNQAAIQPEMQQGVKPEDVVDLAVGRYDVKIKPGPSYQSQREENRERLGEMLGKNPELMPILGDLYFENWDDPIGQQLAKRLRKANPQLEEDEGQQPIPPQVQQQMQQMGQQMEAMTKELESKTLYIETEQAKQQATMQKTQMELALQREQAQREAALELEKARIQADTKIQIAQMEIEAKQQIALMEARMGIAKQAQQMDMERGKMGLQREIHDEDMEMADQQHAADLQHEGEMSEADREQQMRMAPASE